MKRVAKAEARLAKKHAVKKHAVAVCLPRLKVESARYVGYPEAVDSEWTFGNVEELTATFRQFAEMHNSVVKKIPKVIMPMGSDFCEMAGWVVEMNRKIVPVVERG